jgi:hypothetical protein
VRRAARWAAGATLAAAALAARAASAQVGGTVVDGAGRPIEGALVSALDGWGVPRDSARSGAAGRFTLRPRPDSVQLVARRVGYVPAASGWLALADAGDVTLVLTGGAQALRSVIVEGSGARQGFAARMAAGGRHRFYLDSAAIARRAGLSVEQLVDRVPYLKSGGSCVVIDGMFVGRAAPAAPGHPSIYLRLANGDLRGMEIYEEPMTMPAELRRRLHWPPGGPPCARVVMLWSDASFEE